MSIQVGSLRWMKEHDPDAYRAWKGQQDAKYYAKNRASIAEYQREWRSINREHLKKSKREYALRNREKISAQRAWHYAANRERIREYQRERPEIHVSYKSRHPERIKEQAKRYRAKNKVPCPGCGRPIEHLSYRKSTVCVECRILVQQLDGKEGNPSRETLNNYVANLTKGEKEQWSNAITLRKAIKPLQKLLNSQKATQRSQISEKNR